jgi:hypothetical protein
LVSTAVLRKCSADVIDTGYHFRPDRHHDHRTGTAGVRTDVADDLGPESEDFALGIEREFRVIDLVAAVIAGEKLLTAAGAPVHRPLELACRPGADDVFRIKLGLHAKAAAYIADANAHLVLRHLEAGLRQRLLQPGGVLATRAQSDAAGLGIEFPDAAARLHAHRHQTLVVERKPGDMLGLREGRIAFVFFAELGLGGDVARRIRPQLRRTRRGCRLDCHDRRQFLVLDQHLPL